MGLIIQNLSSIGKVMGMEEDSDASRSKSGGIARFHEASSLISFLF